MSYLTLSLDLDVFIVYIWVGLIVFCFSSNPFVIFLNVALWKTFGDSSSFSAPVCDFPLEHLSHISKFYFCFHRENSFFHFLWDTKKNHCAWSSRTQQKITCHFLSLKNERPAAGRWKLIHLDGEPYFRDQWHVRNLPALSAEMHFGF